MMRKNPVKNNKIRKQLMAGAMAMTMAAAMTATTMAPMEQAFASTITANNYSFETAEDLTFNTTISENMSVTDKFRYYKFSLAEASSLTISVKSSYITHKKYITIYDENETAVYEYSPSSYNGTASNIYLTGGSYYLKLQYDDTISFTVTKSSPKESFTETQTANNDSFETANTVSLSTQYKGVLAQNDSKDYYKLKMPTEGKLNVNLVNSTNDSVKVVVYDDSNTKVFNKTVNSGSKLDVNVALASGNYYFMVAQSNEGSGTGYYSFKLNHKLSTPTISSIKNSGKKKMTIKWKKVAKAEGYELQYSKHKNFNSGVVRKTLKQKVKSASYGKLTKGKTYYVRIRAYANIDGTKKYSGWSKKSVVIKK